MRLDFSAVRDYYISDFAAKEVVLTLNTRQLETVLLLAKERSFSQVAKMLNISQPALSKQIQAMEAQLEIKLFDRNTTPISLTPAGAYFVQQASELVYQEKQMMRELGRFRSEEKGQLHIGISPFRNLYFMPGFIRKFKQRYPEIQIVLHENNSFQLREDAAEGKFDFAVVNLPVDDTLVDVQMMQPEHVVLVVPNSLLHMMSSAAQQKEVSISDCRELPFVVVSPTQEMRILFDRLCAKADFHPNIAVEVHGGVITAWGMARAGIGATILPQQFVQANHFEENMTMFNLKDESYTRQPVIISKRRQYVPEYTQYAISILAGDEQTTTENEAGDLLPVQP